MCLWSVNGFAVKRFIIRNPVHLCMKRNFTKVVTLLSLSAVGLASGAFSADGATTVNGCVSYPAQATGIYTFDLDSYNPVLVKNNVYASGGGIAYEDYYYGVRYEVLMGLPVVAQQSFSMKTWELSDNYTGSIDDVATDIAYNYDRDEGYGCYFNETGDGFVFASANIEYFSHKAICDLETPLSAMDFDSEGTLWAIDFDGNVYTVDYKTGQLTAKGSTGVSSEWITGGIIDKSTGKFYWSVKTETAAALYSVDLATCTATKLYDLENEEQLGGFYFVDEYAAKVPAKPASSLSLSFSGTSHAGKVQFRPPSTTYDGERAEGEITYHVLANGKEVATGTTTYGAGYISVDFEVEKAGNYCIAVVLSNEAGTGPRVKAKKFIGHDEPKAPGSVSATYADGVVTLRWGSVSSGANGGNIDRTNLKYRVTRYPDGTVISGDAQTTTSMTDELPMPEKRTEYYYTVEAVTGDYVSAPTKSPVIPLGPIEPPFEETFKTSASAIGWSMLNPGPDTNKWQYYSQTMYVRTSADPSDSWVVTPPVILKGGSSYGFSVDLKGYNSSYTEKFEVCYGTSPDALTNVVIEPTEISSGSYATFSGSIDPATDGTYYIGVHAISSKGGYLYMNKMVIEPGVAMTAPAAVSNLVITPDPSGAHSAVITFVTPTETLDGQPLDAITKIELRRDDETVKTVEEEIALGTEATIVDDTDPSAGKHIYTVICHNAAGEGTPASGEAFIGFDKPLAPVSVSLVETDNFGEVTVSWDAVTKDVTGKTLSASDVTYTLLDKTGAVVATGIEGTSSTFQATDAENHAFVQFLVKAVTEGGESALTKSELLPVGTPAKAPWNESFANCKMSTPFGTAKISGDEPWALIASDTDYGIDPVDNDRGMAFLEGYARTVSALFSGKIDISDLEMPALIFYVFNNGGSSGVNDNTIEVQVSNGTGFNTLQTVVVGATGPENQWNKVVMSLDEYAGQTIQVKFIASVVTYRFFYLDALTITSIADNNLTMRGIKVSANPVEPSKEFYVTAEIENTGMQAVKAAFNVNLYMDGEFVDSKRVSGGLEPDAKTTVSFPQMVDVFAADELTYYAEVEYGADEIASDNDSEPVTVLVRRSSVPVPTALSAEVADGNVNLSWSRPDMSTAAPAAVTETFEGVQSWATSIDGWKFIDVDRGSIGGIGSKQLPVSGQQSFFVMDRTYEVLAKSTAFDAKSGNKFLCAMYSMRGSAPVQNDDWAISPELYGGSQVISLYASSFRADPGQTQYNETFEILYSTTGTEISDFRLLGRYEDISPAWTKFEVYLPEGAKYFAIRYVSYDKYMLFVDDVQFIPAGGQPAEVELSGYNIYRDGVKINTTGVVKQTSYVDENPEVTDNDKYTYVVTAVYAEGESRPSNEAYADMMQLGVDGVAYGSLTVSSVPGAIKITGAAGMAVAVVTVDGKVIVSADGMNEMTIPVVAGIYVVTAGDTVAKVIVK